MLNICFSESANGILEQAVHEGYLIESKTVCIPDDLSLGDISNPKNWDTRRKTMLDLYLDQEYIERSCKRCYQEFFDQIYNHEKVLIWYANTPSEFCGLLYTLWLLKETPVAIGAVCCSRTLKRGDNQFSSYYSVSDLRPEEVIRFLPFEVSFSEAEKEEYISEWEKLSDENGELRVYWNETVQTADPSYYDDVILKYISTKPQTVADAVGKFMMTEHLGVNDQFVVSRINVLIQKGVLYSDGDGVSYRDKIKLLRPQMERRILSIATQIDRRQANM